MNMGRQQSKGCFPLQKAKVNVSLFLWPRSGI
jgi:hypothetical protein